MTEYPSEIHISFVYQMFYLRLLQNQLSDIFSDGYWNYLFITVELCSYRQLVLYKETNFFTTISRLLLLNCIRIGNSYFTKRLTFLQPLLA
jgi:hypothetical protein